MRAILFGFVLFAVPVLTVASNVDHGVEYGSGTALVIVRSAKSVLAAVDSKETYRKFQEGVWSAEEKQICKAAPVGPYYSLVAGLDRGSDGFDALREISKAWQPGDSLVELAARVTSSLPVRLSSLLETLRAADPAEFDQRYRNTVALQIALLGVEGHNSKVIILEFLTNQSSGNPALSVRTTECPGNCGRSPSAFFLGVHEKIDQSVQSDSRLVAGLRESNIASLVELERQNRPDLVGGPVAVIRMDSNGSALLQSGACSATTGGLR